jgi:hypothetical protein
MKRTYIALTCIIVLVVLVSAYIYVSQEVEPVVTTSEQVVATSTNNLPPGYDPRDEERWMNDYYFRADAHERIAAAEDHAYFCKLNERYEGPTSCYLFLEKNGTYTSTGLLAQDVRTTLLVSDDSKHILVLEPQKATLIRVADDQRRVLYSASNNEILGYYGNSDFRAKARWVSNTTIEIQVFSIDNSIDDSSPIRTESFSI